MAEIRIRDPKPDLIKLLTQIEKELRCLTFTEVIERLIRGYHSDQKMIADLQKRNTELHHAIQKYYNKEDRMLSIINGMEEDHNQYVSDQKSWSKMIKGMKKHYGRKRPASRRS